MLGSVIELSPVAQYAFIEYRISSLDSRGSELFLEVLSEAQSFVKFVRV